MDLSQKIIIACIASGASLWAEVWVVKLLRLESARRKKATIEGNDSNKQDATIGMVFYLVLMGVLVTLLLWVINSLFQWIVI